MTREDILKGIVIKLDAIAQNITGSSETGVSGVKGQMEENFRTGNVNLTPYNIGAVPAQTYAEDMTEIDNEIKGINALYGASLALSLDTTSYILKISLLNKEGTLLSEKEVDLPLESMIINARYDKTKKELVIELQSGESISIPLADLVSGLVPDSRKIAGVDLKDDITESEMRAALHVPSVLNDLTDGARVTTAEGKIAANTTEISRHSSQIADISDEIKVEKSIVVDDYALVESGSGVLNDFMVYGRSKQDKTSGKNLLDCTNVTAKTENGITFTPVYDNGRLQYINVNGTAMGNAWCRLTSDFDFNNIIYSIGERFQSVYLAIYEQDDSTVFYRDDASNLSSVNVNKVGVKTKVYIYVRKDSVLNNVKVYPMIRLASITDPTYEPYTNGASPNPQYPSAIRANNGIKTQSKNIWDALNGLVGETTYGVTAKINGDSIIVNGTATGTFNFYMNRITLDAGTYTISGCPKNNDNCRIIFSDGVFHADNGDGYTFTLTETKEIVAFIRVDVGKTANNLVFRPMIEVSNSKSDFVPHASTESALPTLYGIPVASGGNYVDKDGQHWISDTLDLEKGTITRQVDRSKLDETQSIDNKTEWALSAPVTEPIPQSTLNSIRQLRSFADSTHIYCDNGSLEAIIAENTEVGNAIGRNAIKINEILNLLNPVTASVEE